MIWYNQGIPSHGVIARPSLSGHAVTSRQKTYHGTTQSGPHIDQYIGLFLYISPQYKRWQMYWFRPHSTNSLIFLIVLEHDQAKQIQGDATCPPTAMYLWGHRQTRDIPMLCEEMDICDEEISRGEMCIFIVASLNGVANEWKYFYEEIV